MRTYFLKIIGIFLVSLNLFGSEVPELLVFVKKNCTHCENSKEFLNEISSSGKYSLKISFLPVENAENMAKLKRLGLENNTTQLAVPAFYYQGKLLIGFQNRERIMVFLGLAESPLKRGDFLREITLPFFGKKEIKISSLFVFTVFLGLVDGFNPCAMWVLLFLLSILVNIQERKKVLLISGTFVLMSGLVYFMFMAAWLNFFILVDNLSFLKKTIALIAFIVGMVHIKDFFFFKKGITFSIPENILPKIFQQIQKILQEKKIALIFLSTAVLAFFVNFVEFLCTVGLPVVYGQILAEQHLSSFMHYYYLVIYNLAYIFDDALMVIIAVWSMKKFKLQERGGRWLKLLGGGVLVGISIYLLYII
jgi:glutaredoxin